MAKEPRSPEELERLRKRNRIFYLALFIFACVALVNVLIGFGVGGSTLVATLEADGTWGIVILGVLLVIFQYTDENTKGKPPPETP